MAARLVLASASPRRRDLLAQLGVPFDVVASEVAEIPEPGESAEAFARRAARDKALEVGRRCPGALVLAADTVVILDGVIFGKPRDRADARRMLEALSGRTHAVLTAVALGTPAGAVEELQVRTEVVFRRLTTQEIEEHLATNEPYDKAGAYGLQGHAQRFVVEVRGSHSNVVGLPVDEVCNLLDKYLPRPTAMPPAL